MSGDYRAAMIRGKALEVALVRRTPGQALPDLFAQAEEIETWLRAAVPLSAEKGKAGQPRRG